ncbi:MAG: type II toxin-antitoxin system PemK/MazF family toxin [Verrucomicrobia bacterium]|nr:type II toxin-antitoxin system PemK/MazF family toxin [Verrucomicrobiota bacterium]
MHPQHGEVWLADLGIAGKTRPVVVLLADQLDAPRTLVIYVPITKQSRGSDLEIPVGHLPFLDPASVANVQAIGALPSARFEKRLGVAPANDLAAIKRALVKACALT